MPDVVVLDASAVLDAASPGARFDAYTRLQERFACRAPALLAWELGNVVHGRRAPAFGPTPFRRARALELLLAGIDLVASDEDRRSRAGELAAKHGLTFYDASYLDVATDADGAVLLTHDVALAKAGGRMMGPDSVAGLDDIPRLLARAGE